MKQLRLLAIIFTATGAACVPLNQNGEPCGNHEFMFVQINSGDICDAQVTLTNDSTGDVTTMDTVEDLEALGFGSINAGCGYRADGLTTADTYTLRATKDGFDDGSSSSLSPEDEHCSTPVDVTMTASGG